MKHLLVSVYKDCSNKSPGVKTGPAPGVSLFLNIYVKKKLKKSSFKKTNELDLRCLAWNIF
jgi:hypothetical protein